MHRATCLVLVAVLTASAHAQSTRVIFESSPDLGQTWRSGNVNYPIPPSSTVELLFRVRVQLVNPGTNSILGFAGMTFQPKITGWSASDVRLPFSTSDGSGVMEQPQTNFGRILPFDSAGMGSRAASGTLTSHVDGGNTLRFAGANATTQTRNIAWGVGSGQLPQRFSGTDFRTGTDVVVFRFGVSIAIGASNRDLSFTTDLASILEQRGTWYRSATGLGNLYAPILPNDILTQHVSFTPAPGVLTLAGMAGLVATRRRR